MQAKSNSNSMSVILRNQAWALTSNRWFNWSIRSSKVTIMLRGPPTKSTKIIVVVIISQQLPRSSLQTTTRLTFLWSSSSCSSSSLSIRRQLKWFKALRPLLSCPSRPENNSSRVSSSSNSCSTTTRSGWISSSPKDFTRCTVNVTHRTLRTIRRQWVTSQPVAKISSLKSASSPPQSFTTWWSERTSSTRVWTITNSLQR